MMHGTHSAANMSQAGKGVQASIDVQDAESPVQKKNPRTRFTEKILKTIIGNERANMALQSLSMGIIPGGAFTNTFNLGCTPIKSYHNSLFI